MLGNIICWCAAIGIMLSKSADQTNLYTKTLLAMGFIFLGILSKTADYYHEAYKSVKEEKKDC